MKLLEIIYFTITKMGEKSDSWTRSRAYGILSFFIWLNLTSVFLVINKLSGYSYIGNYQDYCFIIAGILAPIIIYLLYRRKDKILTKYSIDKIKDYMTITILYLVLSMILFLYVTIMLKSA